MPFSTRRAIACLAAILTAVACAAPVMGQAGSTNTPRQLLDSWVDLWGSYDLDMVAVLFLHDDALTYFSSETEGLIQGFDRIVEHHEGFGFVAGGAPQARRIWVDEVSINEFGDTAVIGAIWYFGDPESPDDAQRGPMSVMAIRTAVGYRIAHMHFATYSEELP